MLFLQKRGLDLIDARRGAFTLGAVMMIGVAFTGVVKDPLVAVALISLAGFAHQTLSVTMITMATDLFPQQRGRHGGRHGRHLRQFRDTDLHL